LVKWFISNLPAYRPGLNPFRRGLEVGMAHGYLLFGPFHRLGPLRNAPNATLAGLLGSLGLVVILTACLSLYANSNPGKALASIAVPNPPVDAFNSKESWNNFASAFLIGGIGDDTLQRRQGGQVQPDGFTHGTSAQRVEWLRRGYESGDPAACDTFRAL
jgi:photosystem I subunit 11